MSTTTAASLINFLGFITGIVLYGMLLWMVLSVRRESNRLVLSAGLLGFVWNVGAFSGYGLISLDLAGAAPLLLATAFGALSFLPAVMLHSALLAGDLRVRRWRLPTVVSGYLMSGSATIMQFHSAAILAVVPSQIALRAVTLGFGALLIVLLLLTRGQKERGRVLWVVAMAVFAVSALHLSDHQGGEDPWWLALVGHHASLPLALLVLYQDFRFALADIFLKRALAFMLLVGLTFGSFVLVIAPLLTNQATNERSTIILVGFSILMRVSGLLRGVLRSSEEFVTIGEELDLIEAYLDIERARFEDRLRVHIDLPWELRHIRVPALVIQPVVENAIKHGFCGCISGGEVRIAVRLEDESLLLFVRDTGPGASKMEVERGKERGLGLSNVEQRLKRYGAGATPLNFTSEPGLGTTVEVRIPVRPWEVTAAV